MKSKFLILLGMAACAESAFAGSKAGLASYREFTPICETVGGSGRDGASPHFMLNTQTQRLFVAKTYSRKLSYERELMALRAVGEKVGEARVDACFPDQNKLHISFVPGVSLGTALEIFTEKQAQLVFLSPLLAREMLLQLRLLLSVNVFPVDCNIYNFHFHEKKNSRYATLLDFADALPLKRDEDNRFTFETSSHFRATMPKQAYLPIIDRQHQSKKVTVSPEKVLTYAVGANLMNILENTLWLKVHDTYYTSDYVQKTLSFDLVEELRGQGQDLRAQSLEYFILIGGVDFLAKVFAEKETDQLTLAEALAHPFLKMASLISFEDDENSDSSSEYKRLFSDDFWEEFGVPHGSRSPRHTMSDKKIATPEGSSPLTTLTL